MVRFIEWASGIPAALFNLYKLLRDVLDRCNEKRMRIEECFRFLDVQLLEHEKEMQQKAQKYIAERPSSLTQFGGAFYEGQIRIAKRRIQEIEDYLRKQGVFGNAGVNQRAQQVLGEIKRRTQDR